ncbi:DUF72 domain-containing protein [Actinomycetes bacterium NPDC127524]
MIYVGVTGWGDHDSLYSGNVAGRDRLKVYGSHFPAVEVDASFYAVQPKRNTDKWVRDTPESFRFIVKAYQGMTGHQRGENPFPNKSDMFAAFRESLKSYSEAGKLAMVLFQFPPWFDCTKENVDYLRWCKQEMNGIPSALEFRNNTWFLPQMSDKTLAFMKEEGWIHTVCDEPQAGEGSVPIVLQSSNPEAALVRFHGRNVHGWNKPSSGNWREVRYLYRYNKQELQEWASKIKLLQKNSKDVYVLFNNNSGGDAAGNAKEMIDLLGLTYIGLAPKQLDLF